MTTSIVDRVPELLFQPSMLGIEQAGLAETIGFVLSKMSEQEQNRVVQVRVKVVQGRDMSVLGQPTWAIFTAIKLRVGYSGM